ncbi:hypothetical protein H4R34_005553 [Dimargaris verticillata]|uniref:JmjC domain-containing protein n=1 Tax=Dimargaris verticillata TaxID=2761393 RepID=A0A9W8E629_9FUNG|nr:hypothetical protein H4R34_005553 [Dimargaris verticillata]
MPKRSDSHWAAKIRKCKQRARSEPSHDSVARIDYNRVSREAFILQYQNPGLPVVITSATQLWPATTSWTLEALRQRFGREKFKIGEDDDGKAVYLRFKHFMRYVQEDAPRDDSPLYIFDSNFKNHSKRAKQAASVSQSFWPSPAPSRGSVNSQAVSSDDPDEDTSHPLRSTNAWKRDANDQPLAKRVRVQSTTRPLPQVSPLLSNVSASHRPGWQAGTKSELLRDYRVPRYFGGDLFQLAGQRRPPYRWFVVGPARSGTGIHLDPLGTSAWNALVVGHKRWALFPPSTPRALVDPPMKPFDREAASWFYHAFPQFRQPPTAEFFRLFGAHYGFPCHYPGQDYLHARNHRHTTLGHLIGMVEVLHHPGETIFVPGGWHHVVINLDFTVAITQNFCAPVSFDYVWLKTRFARPGLAAKLQRELNRRSCQHALFSLPAIPSSPSPTSTQALACKQLTTVTQTPLNSTFVQAILKCPAGSPLLYRLLSSRIPTLATIPCLFTSSSNSSSSSTLSSTDTDQHGASSPASSLEDNSTWAPTVHTFQSNELLTDPTWPTIATSSLDTALLEQLKELGQTCACLCCQQWRCANTQDLG